jgi:integrase/recombinase XerD
MNSAHTSIFLDTRRPLKDDTYPVRLRITFQRQRKYYTTKYSFSEADFRKIQEDQKKGKLKDI